MLEDVGTVRVVGDVNGDGAPDTAEEGDDPSGKCYPLRVSFRRAPDMAVAGGFEITDSANGCPGASPVAFPAGDVNGDHIGDFAVQTTPRQAYRHKGRLYVVFGKPDSGPVDLAQLGDRGFAIEDSGLRDGSPSDELEVATGDVDGDGLSDLLISGRPSEYAPTPKVVLGKADSATVDLRNLGSRGFAVQPPPDTANEDIAQTTIVGDMNGDGRAELAMALKRGDPAKDPDAGTFVIFGRTGTDPVTAGRDPAEFRIAATGMAVAVGDVNGDGRGDLAVNRQIFFGRADTGPVKPGTGGFGEQGEDECTSEFDDTDEQGLHVAAAGDINGDGLDDVVIGCKVVFGKRDDGPVTLDPPTADGFVVKNGSEPVVGLRGIGDVTGDGRGDLIAAGDDASGATLIRSPALLTAPAPIELGAAGATVPVLCLMRSGCIGEVTLRALIRFGCGGAAVAKDEVVGSGALQLSGGELGAVPIAVPERTHRLARCLLGLAVVERASLAPPESAWARESYSELIPIPAPAGRAWSPRGRRVLGRGDLEWNGFTFLFDGGGSPYALFNISQRKTRSVWLARDRGRPRRLPLQSASMASFDRRHLLVAGVDRGRRARYSLMRGGAGVLKALDPGHITTDSLEGTKVVVASNGRGLGLAVVRRQGRRFEQVVARFVGRGAGRHLQVLPRADGNSLDAAVDAVGNGIVAWCSDPKSGYAIARNRGRFGQARSLGPNVEGQCGDIDVATGPGGRFTIAWTTQVTPYNPPNGPLEIRITTGRIGGRARSFTLDEIPDSANPVAVGLAAAYNGTHPVVGWTSYDPVTERPRVMVADVATGAARWLSPPKMYAAFGDLSASRGSVSAVWGPVSDLERGGLEGVYASYAAHGIDFGAPERIARTARRDAIESAQVAFAPGSRRPNVAALNAGRAKRTLIVARRPR